MNYTMDMATTMQRMQACVKKLDATVGVPRGGLGFIAVIEGATGHFIVGGPDDGLWTTTDKVVVFDFVEVGFCNNDPDRLPYLDPQRPDLCPNIIHLNDWPDSPEHKPKQGRNERCACESGKKFKKCCGAKAGAKGICSHSKRSCRGFNAVSSLCNSRNRAR